MSDGIPYVTKSWNPLAMRCTRCSPGCEHCWHLRMANRMANNRAFSDAERAAYAGMSCPVMRDKICRLPLTWRTPQRVAVQFMGDLFHPKVPYDYTSQIFATMAIAKKHTFLVLTKRPDYLWQFIEAVRIGTPWPLPNVLLGVTVEDQARADERMPHLMKLAAMGWRTWVSYEPALSNVDWTPWLMRNDSCGEPVPHSNRPAWLVAGGESGPGARPMHPDWARTARVQCVAAGVPFYFKQWGEWAPFSAASRALPMRPCRFNCSMRDGQDVKRVEIASHLMLARVGAKAAGRLLDGKIHDELP